MATTIDSKVKTFIIEAIAMFDSYATIVGAIQERFGITVSRQLVRSYDPTLPGRKSKVWHGRRAMFDAARENFLNAIVQVPSAHRAVRLRALDRMASKAEEMRNYQLAAQLLEQIAKEVGDVYTNRRNLQHSGGLTIEDFLCRLDEQDEAGHLEKPPMAR